jgi:hypothetical protein
MQHADSTDPAKYLPEIGRSSSTARRAHRVRRKGDRRTPNDDLPVENGNEPIAIIKQGKTTKVDGDGATAAPAAARHSACVVDGTRDSSADG